MTETDEITFAALFEDPHEAAVARETQEIAFVAAIQHLPGTSVPAVTSALQRARRRLRDRLPARRLEWARGQNPTEEGREIARRYIEAIEHRDFVAFAIYLRAPGAARYRALALAVVRVEQGRVIEVIHWDRPELFEAFGLPISFPPSGRFNQDEVNESEGR